MLDKQYCELGFGNLGEFEQNLLRGALVKKVNASCPDCSSGIDLTEASYSVKVFAEGMLANCEQVGRIITNLTDFNPGQVSSYEDLWRFTLVNYNAGPGDYVWYVRTGEAVPTGTYASTARNPYNKTTYGTVNQFLRTGYSNSNAFQFDMQRRYQAVPLTRLKSLQRRKPICPQ